MRIVWIIAGVGLIGLAGCQRPLQAPGNPGVCWRLAEAANGKPDFKAFAYNVENLENCAAQLEGAHLANKAPMVGAFQGRIIYVTNQDVTVAADGRSQRYRVFTPAQRARIDEGYKALRDREAGR